MELNTLNVLSLRIIYNMYMIKRNNYPTAYFKVKCFKAFYLVLIGNLDGLFPFSIKLRNIGCLLLVASNSSGNDRDCCFICFIPPVVSESTLYVKKPFYLYYSLLDEYSQISIII